MSLYLPKQDIYNILKTLPYSVSQVSNNIFNEFPAITFQCENNNTELFLNNEIAYQDILIIIDIWAEDSVTCSRILKEVENLMRKNKYKLTFSSDIPNPDDTIYHITTRFITKVG